MDIFQRKRKPERNETVESPVIKRRKSSGQSLFRGRPKLDIITTTTISDRIELTYTSSRCNSRLPAMPRIETINDLIVECLSVDLPPAIETLERNGRNTRGGIVKVLADFKKDLDNNSRRTYNEDYIKKLLRTMRNAIKQNALTFSVCDQSDATSIQEIKEFSAWWSIGLSACYFIPSCKACHQDITTFLKDAIDLTSNRSIRSFIIDNFLHILSQIVVPKTNRVFSVTMTYKLQHPAILLQYRIPINGSNENGALQMFSILSSLIDDVYCTPYQNQMFYELLHRAWLRFRKVDKFRLVTHFRYPTDVLTKDEDSFCCFVCNILQYSFQEKFIDEDLFLLEKFCDALLQVIPMVSPEVLSKIYYRLSIMTFFSNENSIPLDGRQMEVMFKILKVLSTFSLPISSKIESIKYWAVHNLWNRFDCCHPLVVDVLSKETVNYIEYNIMEKYEQCGECCDESDSDGAVSQLRLTSTNRSLSNICVGTSRFSSLLGEIYNKISSGKSKLVLNAVTLSAALSKTLPFLQMCSDSRTLMLEFVHSETNWTLMAELIPIGFLNNWCEMALWAVILSPLLMDETKIWNVLKLVTGALPQLCDIYQDHTNKNKSSGESILKSVQIITNLACVSFTQPDEYSNLDNFPPLRLFKSYLSSISKQASDDKYLMRNLLDVIKSPVIRDYEGDYIIAQVIKFMKSFEDSAIITVLELIGEFWWPIRSISFLKIVHFVTKVVRQRWWKSNKFEGRAEIVAKAIVKLPCIYSNRRHFINGEGDTTHLNLLKGCKSCDFNEDAGTICDQNIVNTVSKLCKMFLKDGGDDGTAIVLDVLKTIEKHCDFRTTLFSVILTWVDMSDEKVLRKLFEIATNLAKEKETIKYHPPSKHRLEIVETFCKYLRRNVSERSEEERVKIGAIIALHFLHFIKNADETLMLAFVKLAVHLTVMCMNNGIAESFCKIIGVYEIEHGYSPSDIFCQHKYVIAKALLEAFTDNIFSPNNSHWKVDTKKFRTCVRFLEVVSSLSTAKFKKLFFPAVLSVIVPGVDCCLPKQFMILALSSFTGNGVANLLTEHFVNFYPHMELDGNYNSCVEFLKNEYNFDVNEAGENQIRDSATELMCHMYKSKAKLSVALSHILYWDPEVKNKTPGKKPLIADVEGLIRRYIWAIFTLFSNRLASNSESVVSKRRIILSFAEVINIMGTTLVCNHRTKIYAALIAMFTLGPKYYDVQASLWLQYLMNLDEQSLRQMCPQITSAIITFQPTHPEEADKLIKFLQSYRSQILISCGSTLHFLPHYFKNEGAILRIKNSVETQKKESWLTFFELLVGECGNQNGCIRYEAVKALRDLMKTDEAILIQTVLQNQHPSTFQLIESLITASRDEDVRIKSLVAECLGIMGALNPNKFSANSVVNRHWKGPREFTINSIAFVTKYLEELVNIFRESVDTLNFDYAAGCIQDVVKLFKIQNLVSNTYWIHLSPIVKDHIHPLLDGRYDVQGTKHTFEAIVVFPIYSAVTTFEDWLTKWSIHMITTIKHEFALSVFKSNRRLMMSSPRLCNFIVSYIAFYAILDHTTDNSKYVLNEIQHVIKSWESSERVEYSMTQAVALPPKPEENVPEARARTDDHFAYTTNPVHKSALQIRSKIKAGKESKEQELMKLKCTKTIFSVMDHLYTASRHLNKLYSLPTNHPTLQMCPIPFTKDEVDNVNKLLHQISYERLAIAAFHSNAYTRALLYLEQHVRKYTDKSTESLELFQRIFISLNDMDSAMAVANRRTGTTSFDENIMDTMINGKIEEVVSCFEDVTATNSADLLAHEGLINSYLSLDQPQKASLLLQSCLQLNFSWTIALEEPRYAILLKLGDWGAISSRIERATAEDKLVSFLREKTVEEKNFQFKWNRNVATTLLELKKSNYSQAQQIIDSLRLQLMESFSSASANIESSFKGHYKELIGLHILSEIQIVLEMLQGSEITSIRKDSLRSMLQRWNKRLHIVQNCEHYFRPILDTRKVLLSILIHNVNHNSEAVDLLNSAVRDCWLFAARQERKNGKLFRSARSLANANTSELAINSPEILIESAKLQIQKGVKDKALAFLQTALKGLGSKGSDNKIAKLFRTSSSSYLHSEDKDYEKKLHSKALLLHAKLCDEMRIVDQETNVANFNKAIKVMKNSENNYFASACYFDRLSNSADLKFCKTHIQCLTVKHYAESLKHGVKYIYQSLPRLLTIWLDLGSEAEDISLEISSWTSSNSDKSPKFLSGFSDFGETQSREYMIRVIDSLAETTPVYVFMTAFSQLVSRLCHSERDTWDMLSKLLVSIICTHPYQALWMTMTVAKSSYKMRSQRIREIYKKVEEKTNNKAKNKKSLIVDYTTLSEKLIQLSNASVDKKTATVHLNTLLPSLPKLLASKNFSQVLIPFQQYLFPKLPAVTNQHKDYNPFPLAAVHIESIESQIQIMTSLQRPKKITFRGSDGQRYGMMCKPKDDLRKDCKVMEVNNVINHYLNKKNPGLRVRTYAVIPLNEECGLLEWVDNLQGLRPIVNNLYKEKKMGLASRLLMEMQCRPEDSLERKRAAYLEKFLPSHPPVFSEWFLYNFPNHRAWYQARLNYMKTAAVMSIVGFIFGLGDRHGENMMLDTLTGDVVHVDFNCLFLEGENLRYAERVPFRLTQNMVDAMGLCGSQGVFKKSCELTLATIREHQSILLSVLRPFVFDPLVEWGEVVTSLPLDSSGQVRTSQSELRNSKAVENMKYIGHRINGTARCQTKTTNTELSVEAHVAYLMDEATNVDNLCQMYIGWAAFI